MGPLSALVCIFFYSWWQLKANVFCSCLHLLLQLVAAYGKRFVQLSASSSVASGS
jgi:hypothetical protein